jgi:hypothetical protein
MGVEVIWRRVSCIRYQRRLHPYLPLVSRHSISVPRIWEVSIDATLWREVYTGLFENSDSNALMPRFKHSPRVELQEPEMDIRDVSSQHDTIISPKEATGSWTWISDICESMPDIHHREHRHDIELVIKRLITTDCHQRFGSIVSACEHGYWSLFFSGVRWNCVYRPISRSRLIGVWRSTLNGKTNTATGITTGPSRTRQMLIGLLNVMLNPLASAINP